MNSEGAMPLITKDEGAGVMISAFVSREFGYGTGMIEQEMNKVNDHRRNKTYSDKLAAINRAGNANKKPLTSDPFLLEFEYVSNGEIYWNYEAMSMQFEDFIDCMSVLYPIYDVVWLFDHSCGHDRKRPDGLNLNGLSKGYSGKQVKMRTSEIKQIEGYLGPYTHLVNLLQIGSFQSMVFSEDDTGSYRLGTNHQKYDKNTGVAKKEKRKLAELLMLY